MIIISLKRFRRDEDHFYIFISGSSLETMKELTQLKHINGAGMNLFLAF